MSSPAPALDPRHTALLVMDFQQGVVRRIPGPEPLLQRVQQAIADMRDHGGTIAYVRVAFTEEEWAPSRGTEDPDADTRDVLLKRVFPRRAQVIESAALRALLRGTIQPDRGRAGP